jgi:hypothetical protein
MATTKSSASPASAAAPDDGGLGPLNPEQVAAVGRLTRDLPPGRVLVGSELSGLGMDALEGYQHGEGRRYDTQGHQWDFRREAVNDQWQMTIYVSYFGIPLAEGGVPLDRVAGKEGEDQMLALVEALARQATIRHNQAVAQQQAMRAEADAAVAPLTEAEPDAGS